MPDPSAVSRRRALQMAAGICGATWDTARAQPDFPDHPLKIIVPYQAGGVVDAGMRAIASQMKQVIGQAVVVDNKPGGLFMVAFQALQAAAVDGHTLLAINGSMTAVQLVSRLYDFSRVVAPVSVQTAGTYVLVVNSRSPFQSMAELARYGRAHPGKLNYGVPGLGQVEHLKIAQIAKAMGFQAVVVPYKSGAPDIVRGILGDEVEFGVVPTFVAQPFVAKSLARTLVVMDEMRLKEFPDVPTLAEAGIGVASARIWGGFGAHPDTPPALVQRLYQLVAETFKSQALVDRLTQMGLVVGPVRTPEETRRLMASDKVWMGEMVADLRL